MCYIATVSLLVKIITPNFSVSENFVTLWKVILHTLYPPFDKETLDGRGISQLERCKKNYAMLNLILDERMPWHREVYDFRSIDINRYFEKWGIFPFMTLWVSSVFPHGFYYMYLCSIWQLLSCPRVHIFHLWTKS